MFYNTNCNKQENNKKQCYKIVGEFYVYPSYYEEDNKIECHCKEKDNNCNNDNEFNFYQNNNYKYSCNKEENKENNCKSNNRCCCFRRWWC